MSVALGVTTLVLGILLVITERKRSEIVDLKMKMEILQLLSESHQKRERLDAYYRNLREDVEGNQEDILSLSLQRNAGDDGNDSGYESETQ